MNESESHKQQDKREWRELLALIERTDGGDESHCPHGIERGEFCGMCE